MAKVALLLFFLPLLINGASGTLVGFYYNASGSTAASSISRAVSILEQNKVSSSRIRVLVADHRILSSLSNSNVSVDLYLNETLIKNLLESQISAISWLKTNVVSFLPRVNIKSITVNGGSHFPELLLTLKSIRSALCSVDLESEVRVSVAFPLSVLEGLDIRQEKHLHRVLGFIRRIGSFVTVEASNVEQDSGDLSLQSTIQKLKLSTFLHAFDDVPLVVTTKNSVSPSAKEVSEFADKVSKYLENIEIAGRVAELYADVSSMEDFVRKELEREKEQIFPSSRRELLSNLKTILHDTMNPPVVFPTPPVTDNPTPTIVTVPGSITPTNPVSTPLPIPSTTPVTFPPPSPSTNPPAVPITNPVTTPAAPITVPGAQPITNPVTTYPAPPGNVPSVTPPVMNPVVPPATPLAPPTTPLAPPATTNAPAVPGQSWCVAKSGALETALQSALDYACGMGGADCSVIQQGGSCYNPNSLQNHASFAFNSYYQKNPVATSCDFGGTASIVNTNPSAGSCIYPSSSSTSALPTPTPTPTTSTANPPPTTTTPSSPPAAAGGSSTGVPPSVLNSSNPASSGSSTTDFGSVPPPAFDSSTSKSATFRPFIGCVVLAMSCVAGIIALDM